MGQYIKFCILPTVSAQKLDDNKKINFRKGEQISNRNKYRLKSMETSKDQNR